MNHLTIYSLLLLFIVVSCGQEEPLEEVRDLSVPEVEQFFDQHYTSSTQARKNGKRKINN